MVKPALKTVEGGAPREPSPENDPVIPLAIRGMTVAYGGKPVVYDVDFVPPAGRMAAIIGPNGAGKSSLLKAALGIVPSVSGRVSILRQAAQRGAGAGRLRAAAGRRRLGLPGDGARCRRHGPVPPDRPPPLRGQAREGSGAGLPRAGRHGGLRRTADRPALGRAAAARLPRPRAGAGGGSPRP